MTDSLKQYLKSIEESLKTGQATEHTYRAALQTLLNSQIAGLTVINEAHRIVCGAPDLTILKDNFTIGYVEAKDIGKSLDEAERSGQLKRYLHSLDNLILTDYLEFRWYVKGDRRQTATLGAANLAAKKINRVGDLSPAANLLAEFLAQGPEHLTSSQDIARRMAKLTHLIRDIVMQAFEQNQASDLAQDLRQALAHTLLPDLDQPDRVSEFADIYAQTIAYGLFAARCNHKGPGPFKRSEAAAEIPKTNPFLRRLFTAITGPDLVDEPYAGFVQDLVQVLAHADMEAILADFGRRAGQEDPIVHFYETFLATYDPKLRELRGVYYTPAPVVSYIVRSVDHLLKTRFDLPAGLADTTGMTHNGRQMPRMLLLDPATGTGTFLYGVIEHIRNSFRRHGNAGMWSGYVKEHLLKKLFGFELLMVPYAVAHFKLALQLAGQDLDEPERRLWAYDFSGDERLRIYLTNTLEEIEREVQTLFGLMRIITEEAKAAAEVKQELPILVVMGNPPYSGHSANRSWLTDQRGKQVRTFVGQLLQDYYQVDGHPLGERNPKWLQDDYVKFIRWGQWRIEQTGAGILAFITNHGYLDNPTFRGMRQNLLNTFTEIYLLNLHGNSKKKETAPDGGKDENVFDIQQGVAIGLFIKEPDKTGPAQVYYTDLWGERRAKYEQLISLDVSITHWIGVEPKSPFYLFVPQDKNLLEEYNRYWKITEAIPVNVLGFQTHRDHFAVDFEHDQLHQRIKEMRDTYTSNEEYREKYDLRDNRDWQFVSARQRLRLNDNWESDLVRCLYRPFDWRWCYFTEIATDYPRRELKDHVVGKDNLCFLSPRQQATLGYKHAWVAREPANDCVISTTSREANHIFPLYLYPDPTQLFSTSPYPPGKEGRTPNFSPQFVAEVATRLGLVFTSEGRGDLQTTFGPEDIFYYLYAILYCPTYRARYAEFLKIDFPRIPLTCDRELFAALVELGQELVKLHLLEQVPPSPVHYPVKGDDEVAKGHPKYNEAARRVYLNQTQYFEGIEPEEWGFYIGGYQVLEKWLKDRQGRKLTYSDLTHYQQIAAALKRTIELMAEIDEVIPGWPL